MVQVTAYVINDVNTYGNAGRNTVFQDGTKNMDISLFRNFHVGEGRTALQLRAEFFNILNNVNFDRPGASVNGANFGTVTATEDAREIQFARKFIW